MRQEVGTQLRGESSHVSFTAGAVSMDFADEGMGIVPASGMPATIFTDKTVVVSLAQIPH